MKIIVGLGNPGPQYETTRHNAGFLAVDMIGDALKCPSVTKKCGCSLISSAVYRGEKLILAKPQCYMNRSGLAVAELAVAFSAAFGEFIVIHDDVDLDLGRMRIRTTGGDGGHKGLQSIIRELGTGDFCRVKIGVGRPPEGMETPDYVTSVFHDSEWEILKKVLPIVKDAVLSMVTQGPEAAMNRYNRTFINPPAAASAEKLIVD